MAALDPLALPAPGSTFEVAERLRDLVLASEDGALLGGEDELVARFGVSRPTFRQAARILQAEGLLDVRRGVNGGLFARLPSSTSAARSLAVLLRYQGMTSADLIGAIYALTGETARQAAAHPRAADRRRVARRISRFEPDASQTEPVRMAAAGTQFGIEISSLAHNAIVPILLQVLIELLAQQELAPPGEGHLDELTAFHHRVAGAIEAGDETAVLEACNAFRARVEAWGV